MRVHAFEHMKEAQSQQIPRSIQAFPFSLAFDSHVTPQADSVRGIVRMALYDGQINLEWPSAACFPPAKLLRNGWDAKRDEHGSSYRPSG
ncbi:hypothetical protein AAHC03_019003 [Spirometra sp. Aus1]